VVLFFYGVAFVHEKEEDYFVYKFHEEAGASVVRVVVDWDFS